MQLGMIGLGRMGANLSRRAMRDGHELVVHDLNEKAVDELVGEGASGAASLGELVAALEAPRALWLMLPAALVGDCIDELTGLLSPGDIVIDGGNSYYRDDLERAAALVARGLHFVDCGTSGGIYGLERGYCLMVGGEQESVAYLAPLFASLAPGIGSAEATPGRSTSGGTAEQGWLHCGPAGAGHFVKMVHNGVEYGMMAAIAEGLSILANANEGSAAREHDAETAPLREPEAYRYDFAVAEIAEVWRRGSVVSSFLVDLIADALARSPRLEEFTGRVSDSGEGRWTVEAAIDLGVPAPVIAASLFERFASQRGGDFADRVLSSMRSEFGGHAEKAAPQ